MRLAGDLLIAHVDQDPTGVVSVHLVWQHLPDDERQLHAGQLHLAIEMLAAAMLAELAELWGVSPPEALARVTGHRE
jgi:hypothetical protein